jgi:hypothetical protein
VKEASRYATESQRETIILAPLKRTGARRIATNQLSFIEDASFAPGFSPRSDWRSASIADQISQR